jgi:hypothetical protein
VPIGSTPAPAGNVEEKFFYNMKLGDSEEITIDLEADDVGEESLSERTLEAMQRLSEKIKSGEPIPATRVVIEHTPDGPLTTSEDIVI